jgi:polyketide biosynthesis 3-hydroxy-3-methylglutaryl-CoA synthase-like enzyme PksG
MSAEAGEVLTADWSYAEPSGGAGSVAMLISEMPYVFQVDIGANGYYGYEVMDTCRPIPDGEAGDSDLSLLSYLDCCENAFLEYQKRVTGVNYRDTFHYLTFHTPFGGMVKGAHRTMMRKMVQAQPEEIETDFEQRVVPGMNYCQRVGNIMGGTVFLNLSSTIDKGQFDSPKRVGCFSYGSGCCSEFYSGIVTNQGQERQHGFEIERQLDERYKLSMDEYDSLLMGSGAVKFGTRNLKSDFDLIPGVLDSCRGKERLFLKEIHEFHRKYEWIS